MIKYKFIGKKPTEKQNDEIEYYLRNPEFIKVLLMAKTYYIQGFHADYSFTCIEDEQYKRITITIY